MELHVHRSVDRETLRRIYFESGNGPCISLYRSGDSFTTGRSEVPAHLKAASQDIESELRLLGFDAPQTFSEPLVELSRDYHLWQERHPGFALFHNARHMHLFLLDSAPEESVRVCGKFALLPLLSYVELEMPVILLHLAENSVQAFRYSNGDVENVTDQIFPPVEMQRQSDLAVLSNERQLQFHTETGANGGGGFRRAMYFGHGGEVDNKAKYAKQAKLYRFLDDFLNRFLRQSSARVALAGTVRNTSMFRELSRLPHLLSQTLEGNFEHLSEPQLKSFWSGIRANVREDHLAIQQEKLELLRQQNRLSSSLGSAVPAAHFAQIDTLYCSLTPPKWGTFSASTFEITLHDRRSLSNYDLIDFTAANAYLHGGEVFVLRQASRPLNGQRFLAALRTPQFSHYSAIERERSLFGEAER